ncbi:uncharacterized protein BO96DRAFT_353074 [Aspergillus niger CBS 101883]|uniref:Uncharacterized protein n=3 Tax=Aspergillus niger TaxID=5061 RepID=A2R9T0_ASPNC|nr:uncharacterized protein BO96DRAFT_353074 [Aspergillus niger CBS 101883]XP_059602850.1 hypothetical protein An18g00080 [Aspergillus niger]PYH50229.1 hypothetical protein BO96DRAFT_353074 [Aspergillus niger CBS 101883]RDH14131.1 hypothetical protein M747DRAFT_250212 [Aspergillus niger ATCC 13496]CAK43086.1 hypothetical protein An18g00080 [Aspergillus niger]
MPHEGILKHPPQLPPSCLPPRVVLPPRSFQSIARKHARSYHPRRQPLRSQTEICHYSGSAHDDIPRHAKELEAGQTWDTSTTYQLQGVGTTAQKPNFGVKVTSVDVRDADPGTPTTPASTFGLTKNEKGNPVMTEKEKTAPMDMVRFDFSGDLSPSNDNTSCLEWPRGTDCLIIVWFPAPSDTNAVKFVIMAPVIQLWVCAYDAEEEHKQDGTFEITYS